MKISNLLKLAGLVGAVSVLAVGCAATTEDAADTSDTTAAPASETPTTTAPVNSSGTSRYQVIRGDSLWGISGKSSVYGNPYQWPLIYKANSDQIKDADLIYPGQVFDINTNPTASEANAAIQHAKTRGSWSIGVVEESDKAYLAQ